LIISISFRQIKQNKKIATKLEAIFCRGSFLPQSFLMNSQPGTTPSRLKMARRAAELTENKQQAKREFPKKRVRKRAKLT
jgi:hypothetical protein